MTPPDKVPIIEITPESIVENQTRQALQMMFESFRETVTQTHGEELDEDLRRMQDLSLAMVDELILFGNQLSAEISEDRAVINDLLEKGKAMQEYIEELELKVERQEEYYKNIDLHVNALNDSVKRHRMDYLRERTERLKLEAEVRK